MLSLKCSLRGGKDEEKWSRGRELREGKEGNMQKKKKKMEKEHGRKILTYHFPGDFAAVSMQWTGRACTDKPTSRWTEESSRLIAM